MGKTKRKIIWSNYYLDFEDWKNENAEYHPNETDDELYQRMCDENWCCLEAERANLDIELGNPILVIGSIGLWNGRVSGYKEIASGNISHCLVEDDDYIEWFIDENGDLRADGSHHDGTNHYLYRVYKDGVSEKQIENLKSKIYYGKATRRDITRITRRLGNEIAKVYGW